MKTGALILCVSLGLVVLLYASTRHDPITAESYRFDWMIPVHVQVMPVVEACAPAVYAYEWREGERAGAGDVAYGTALPPEIAQSEIGQSLEGLGCTATRTAADFQSFDCGAYVTVGLIVTPNDHCAQVQLSVSGDGPLPVPSDD